MTNKQMEYILSIYHEGSIRKAAEKLFISQPALSQQLQRIESEINLRLFERTTSYLKPTYEGKHYLDTLERIHLQFSQEDVWQEEARKLMHGKLSIGISPSRSTQFLPKLLPKFRTLYPDIQIELQEDFMLNLPALLKSNEIDLALMVLDSFAKGFHFIPIIKENLVLAAPKNSPSDLICQSGLSSTGHINIHDLRKEPFIAIKNGGRIRKHADEIYEKYQLAPNIILETKNSDLALQLCSSGYGITIVAELIAESYQRFSNYNYYSLEHEIEPWTLGIACHPDHYVSTAMEAFITLVKKEITIE